ncbi:MAG: SUMF1/EgtB/PvdO family nonheme iron enzyme [Verrucomicrobiae bacterium]|nr:SUMF1/EgtB/PvdO family nonheme iron enzyme [Verrucomicrobiae bacterium]
MTEGYRDDHPRTAPVGSYRPLASGLYDLSGNVWEWCEDWCDQGILKKRRAAGPFEPTPKDLADIMKGDARKVVRGGSWRYSFSSALQSSARVRHPPVYRLTDHGFRCVAVEPASSP